MTPNEAQTRAELIDPALAKAGWKLGDPSQVRIEIPVDGYDAAPWNGVTDYCLYGPNGEVIAVVEAKKPGGCTNKRLCGASATLSYTGSDALC